MAYGDIRINICTTSEAFSETPNAEIARILRVIADSIEDHPSPVPSTRFRLNLLDSDGKPTGLLAVKRPERSYPSAPGIGYSPHYKE